MSVFSIVVLTFCGLCSFAVAGAEPCGKLLLKIDHDWIVSGVVEPPLIGLKTADTTHRMAFATYGKDPDQYPTLLIRVAKRDSVGHDVIQQLMAELIAKARSTRNEWLLLTLVSVDGKIVKKWVEGREMGVRISEEEFRSFIETTASSTSQPSELFVVHNHPLGVLENITVAHPSFSLEDIQCMKWMESILTSIAMNISLRFLVLPDGTHCGINYDDVCYEVLSTTGIPTWWGQE
jgi:hypothetical protein